MKHSVQVLYSGFLFTCLFFIVSFTQVQNTNQMRIYNDFSILNDKCENDLMLVPGDSATLDSIIITEMNYRRIPGLQACIIKNGEVFWTGSYGFANISQGREVSDTTTFLLASISKVFVGTAVMQLWENGIIGLDDNINNYLPPDLQIFHPNFPYLNITFRQLLTHTSSIDEDWGLLSSLFSCGCDSQIPLETFLLDYFLPDGSYNSWDPFNIWNPGSTWEFSSAAVSLLGHLVSVINNTSFEDYCIENIFSPLNMNETSWFMSCLDTANIASPYACYGNFYACLNHYGHPAYPSFMLRTSAIQLAKLISIYMGSGESSGIRILDSTTVDLMTSIQFPSVDPRQGLIWAMYDISIPFLGSRKYCGHGGALEGCKTGMDYMIDDNEKIGVVVLTNGESAAGLINIWNNLYIYAYLYNKIYTKNVELNLMFMENTTDTVIVNTEFVNPNHYNFSANAVITCSNGEYEDIIPLFDDGNHNDGHFGDGIWGNSIPPVFFESTFKVGVNTIDLDSGDSLFLHDLSRFTTSGPVVFEDYHFVLEDTIPNSGDILILILDVRNESDNYTVTNITSELTELDTNVTVTNTYYVDYGDIPPGETSTMSGFYILKVNNVEMSNVNAQLKLEIKSEGYNFWTDTFSIVINPVGIIENKPDISAIFLLNQNYPNPFNPKTTIKYQLPVASEVELSIYNLMGQKIETLVSKKQSAGYYTVEWDATNFASGIYFYRLKTNKGFVKTKKMVVMK